MNFSSKRSTGNPCFLHVARHMWANERWWLLPWALSIELVFPSFQCGFFIDLKRNSTQGILSFSEASLIVTSSFFASSSAFYHFFIITGTLSCIHWFCILYALGISKNCLWRLNLKQIKSKTQKKIHKISNHVSIVFTTITSL